MLWDYIFVGGGLSGSVVSNRLLEYNSSLKILVLEAGPNANNDPSIVWPNSTNSIGGVYDWNLTSVPQVHADGRNVSLPQGKALGGGTVINSGGWIRGNKYDYDLWGQTVGDDRWSYEGILPYIKKTEKFPGANYTTHPEEHGFEGNLHVTTVTSTHRQYPLRDIELESWAQLGVHPIPSWDGNAGNSTGVADMTENRNNGRRQIAAAVYPLDGITVEVNTQVAKVLIDKKCRGSLVAKGVKLANGTEIFGKEVILAAGGIHTPQLLMLSGVGPAAELEKHGIQVKLDNPDVGQNFADHLYTVSYWNVADPAAGWAYGSPGFPTADNYGWGASSDFIVSTGVRDRAGLVAAIEADEGAAPDPATHPLLAADRVFFEHIFNNQGATDGSAVWISSTNLLPTSRGSVTLASAHIGDAPRADPNYLATAVDRFVYRDNLRLEIDFMGGNLTTLATRVLDGEIPPAGFSEGYSVASTDEYIDARVRAGLSSCYHPMGSAAMGKVVDADLKVKGVQHLRIVDASVLPVIITGHLQIPVYALAEQAAVIISGASAAASSS